MCVWKFVANENRLVSNSVSKIEIFQSLFVHRQHVQRIISLQSVIKLLIYSLIKTSERLHYPKNHCLPFTPLDLYRFCFAPSDIFSREFKRMAALFSSQVTRSTALLFVFAVAVASDLPGFEQSNGFPSCLGCSPILPREIFRFLVVDRDSPRATRSSSARTLCSPDCATIV